MAHPTPSGMESTVDEKDKAVECVGIVVEFDGKFNLKGDMEG